MRNVSDQYCRENQIHTLHSVTIFLNRAAYEIMWKILYSRASHGWQCIAFHALCIPDN